MHLDFRTTSTKHSIEKAAQQLNLKLSSNGSRLIGRCPACRAADPAGLVLRPSVSLFFCYEAKVGGDTVGLVQHIRACDAKAAQMYLETPLT